jgi:rhamnosyl/mannosyltransferase
VSIDPRPRILHLGKFYPPAKGGMETILQTMCRGERHAVQSQALVIDRGRRTKHEIVDGVRVTRVGRLLTVGAVAVAPALPVWLARSRPDVVVLHEPNPMALVAYALVRPAVPLIVWYHSEVVRPGWRYAIFYHPFLAVALRRMARIAIASPSMREVPALAAYRTKSIVIPYGLEPDRYDANADVQSRADALRGVADSPILLFVGRLVSYKGLDVLIRAVKGLDARTIIVGDGPLRRELETLARDVGVVDRVRFAGEVADDERLAWLHACAALVLPSTTRQEAFGLVQLEAMFCRRPVVSTDLPTGVPWVNVDGETGVVVRAGDAASLHDALERLLADAPYRRALGEAGRKRALQMFTAEKMCAAMLALYEELCPPRA